MPGHGGESCLATLQEFPGGAQARAGKGHRVPGDGAARDAYPRGDSEMGTPGSRGPQHAARRAPEALAL